MRVPLPTPEGPVITRMGVLIRHRLPPAKAAGRRSRPGFLATQVRDQLVALPLG
jgi:hypothetical protein